MVMRRLVVVMQHFSADSNAHAYAHPRHQRRREAPAFRGERSLRAKRGGAFRRGSKVPELMSPRSGRNPSGAGEATMERATGFRTGDIQLGKATGANFDQTTPSDGERDRATETGSI